MELFLIKSERNSDPNEKFPDGFPGKGEFARYPNKAYRDWIKLRDAEDYNIVELRKCFLNNNITEDLNIWTNIFETIEDMEIPISPSQWTKAKYELYANYLVEPKTRIKQRLKILDGKPYYAALQGYQDFTVWKNLVRYVEKNFGSCPNPKNDEIEIIHNNLKEFKERIRYENGQDITARQYAEFLSYYTPIKFLRVFIMSECVLFPYVTDLIDMYRDGMLFNEDFLINSWYILWDGHDRVRYGEKRFEKEIDQLFGPNKYKIIYV